MADILELQGALNKKAGTNGLGAQGAANVIAGTSGLSLVGALNAKAGTKGLELNGVLNVLAGTSGLGTDLAATTWANLASYTTYINDTFPQSNGTAPTSMVVGETGSGASILVQSGQAVLTSPVSTFSGVGGMYSTDGSTGMTLADFDMTFNLNMSGGGFPILIAGSPAQTINGTYYGVNLNNGNLGLKRNNSFTAVQIGTASAFTGISQSTAYIVRWRKQGTHHQVWIASGGTLPGSPTLDVIDDGSAGGTVLTAAGYLGIHLGGTGGASATLAVDNLLVTSPQ